MYKSRQSSESLSDSTTKDGRSRTETHGDNESVQTSFTSEPSSPVGDQHLQKIRPLSLALVDKLLDTNAHAFPTPRFLKPSTFDPSDLPSGNLTSTAEHMVMQLLISQAIMDTKEFEVLSFEKLDELKMEHGRLRKRITAQTTKLATECKIREAAISILNLNKPDTKLNKQASEQLGISNRKVDATAAELWQLQQKSGEVQQRILQHFAAALAIGLRQHDPAKSPNDFLWQPHSPLLSPRPPMIHPPSPSDSMYNLGSPRAADGKLLAFDGPHFFANSNEARNIPLPPSPMLSASMFLSMPQVSLLQDQLRKVQDDLEDAKRSIDRKDREVSSLRRAARTSLKDVSPDSELGRQKKMYEEKLEETFNLAQQEVTATLIRAKREMDEKEEEVARLKDGIRSREHELIDYRDGIERLETLASRREDEIHNLQAKMTIIEQDVARKEAESRRMIEEMDQEMRRLESELDDSRHFAQEHSSRADMLETDLEELKGRHGDVTECYERIQTEKAEQEATHAETIESHARDISSMRQELSDLSTEHQAVSENLADRDEELSTLKDHVETVVMPRLEAIIDRHRAILSDETVSQLERDVPSDDHPDSPFHSTLHALEQHANASTEHTKSVQSELDQLKSDWQEAQAEWEAEMAKLVEEMTRIRHTLNDTQRHGYDLEQRLDDVEQHRGELQEKVWKMEPLVAKLRSAESDVTRLRAQVTQLNSSITILRGEIAQKTAAWNTERNSLKEEISDLVSQKEKEVNEMRQRAQRREKEKNDVQLQLTQALEFFDGLRGKMVPSPTARSGTPTPLSTSPDMSAHHLSP